MIQNKKIKGIITILPLPLIFHIKNLYNSRKIDRKYQKFKIKFKYIIKINKLIIIIKE